MSFPDPNRLTRCLVTGLCFSIAVTAFAQQSDPPHVSVIGRVAFDYPNAPPASVEVDLGQEMLSSVIGIAQAAVSGTVEALNESKEGPVVPEVARSAEHLQAVNQIVSQFAGVLHEVRVRVYDDRSNVSPETRIDFIRYYTDQLGKANWENVVRVNDGGTVVNVNVVRKDDAIRGILVLVSEGDQLVMANVVCDLTPERIKEVARHATAIGREFGLDQAIQQAMIEMNREVH